MNDPQSPSASIRLLLQSKAVTPVTSKALLERLERRETAPQFFSSAEYELLSAVCDLLTDQTSENRLVPVASFIDERLAEGKSEGWRFNHMPSGPRMYRRGLQGINESSVILFNDEFTSLSRTQKILVLKALQTGAASGQCWEGMSAVTFFEELLAETAEIFYAHPLAQEEISYTGMADAFGWNKIGLNETEGGK